MFRRRQIWMPTWWTALLLIVAVAASALVALRQLATFLALEAPAATRDGRGAQTLIVEGWLDEDALDAAIALIARGRYERVIASGGPIEGWRESQPWPTYAERAADYLRRHGVSATPVIAVAAPPAAQDRTFVSATVVRDWLREHAGPLDAVDLFSGGVHARRSRRVFQAAFGPGVEVGVFAAPPRRYTLAHWWRTSEGAKAVLDEAIALTWTVCCFSAPGPAP
ncbi:MAG TPA: ElyC/SanA/YdcF family protein [Caldimonas sp.]|nr:ElyC/SanA/YdcF family protein [Caldimonas sp.]